MVEFVSEDLTGSRFQRVNLADSLFRLAEFRGAEFRGCELADTWFRVIEMSGVTMRGVELNDVEISGDVGNLKINGVEVRELVEAELDRRYPERAFMRPADAAGFRRAWEVIGRLWDGTVDRARRLDPDLLHESVDGEWSFPDAPTPSARHRRVDQAGSARRPVTVASAGPALGRPGRDPAIASRHHPRPRRPALARHSAHAAAGPDGSDREDRLRPDGRVAGRGHHTGRDSWMAGVP